MAVAFREATPADADRIARLHAESWRRSYRGMVRNDHLDGDVLGERTAEWHQRFASPIDGQFVYVAEDRDGNLSFVCAYGAQDETWGSFIDNLHVAHKAKRGGIGQALMLEAARWLERRYARLPVYLVTLEANHPARRFYERIGGRVAETVTMPSPDGEMGRSCRYVWDTPAAIIGVGSVG